MGYCFGIDIGGTTVKIGLAAEDGTLLEGWEIPTRREPTPEGLLLGIRVSILDRLDRGLDRGKKQKIRRADILGIGMAAPGAVTADGILHGAVNIGWGDVALAEEAERIIGIFDFGDGLLHRADTVTGTVADRIDEIFVFERDAGLFKPFFGTSAYRDTVAALDTAERHYHGGGFADDLVDYKGIF